MTRTDFSLSLLSFSLLCAPLSVVLAGEAPPPYSRPLSAILSSVEMQRLGGIAEAEFDSGLWEVKVCDARACQKLYIDPRSGRETRRRSTGAEEMPPANAKLLSTIVESIESTRSEVITEVEFDDGFWEVELRKDGRKTKLAIDPTTGEARR